MSLAQQIIPIGEPRLWGVEVRGSFQGPWIVEAAGIRFAGYPTYLYDGHIFTYHEPDEAAGFGFSGYAFGAVVFGAGGLGALPYRQAGPDYVLSASFTAQDVLAFSIDAQGQLQVVHTRLLVSPVTATMNGRGVPAPAPVAGVPFVIPGDWYQARAFCHAPGAATVSRLGPDGVNLETTGYLPLAQQENFYIGLVVDGHLVYDAKTYAESADGRSGSVAYAWHTSTPPAEFVTERPGGGGAGRDTRQVGLLGSQMDQIVSCCGVADVGIDMSAARWPSGLPVAGIPFQLRAVGHAQRGTGVGSPLSGILATGHTDASGAATARTGTRPAGWSGPWLGGADFGPYASGLGGNRILAYADTTWLKTGGVDRTQPYASADPPPTPHGYDRTGHWELLRRPALVTAARAASFTVEDGTGAADWQGQTVTFSALSVPQYASTPDADWQIHGVSGGVRLYLPPGDGPSGDAKAGVSRALDAGRGRAFHNYRYLTVHLHASAPGTLSLRVQGGSYALGGVGAGGGGFQAFSLSVRAGDNAFTLDLGATEGAGQTQMPSLSAPITDAAASGHWRAGDVSSLCLDGLSAGVEYVVGGVSLGDKAGSGRTPLRALGSTHPAYPLVPDFYPLAPHPPPTNLLRVLVHGRRCLSVPYHLPALPYEVIPGEEIPGEDFVSADALLRQWRDYFDAGAGVWTLTGHDPALTALLPAVCLEPEKDSVSPTGLTLAGVVSVASLALAPGFELTVAPRLSVRWQWGGLVEGLLQPGTGGVLRSEIQDPPEGDPLASPQALEESASGDADGYFALSDLSQPWWHPIDGYEPTEPGQFLLLSELTGYDRTFSFPPHHVRTGGAAVPDLWAGPVPHRNAFYLRAVGARLGASEKDVAQDLTTGRLHIVASDDETGALTCETRDGRLGLSGDPVRAASPVTDAGGSPRIGAAPSVWFSHEDGVASLVYRNADGSVVRADSRDGLATLGDESMPIFTRTGGYPTHFRDGSTGLCYHFAAFDNDDGTQEVLAARQGPQGDLIPWPDGAMARTVAAAGRPSALPNRYDDVQSILLLHGDLRYTSADGGANWEEIP